jgi:hypothetical protein
MTEFTIILLVVVVNFIISLIVSNFVFNRYWLIIEKLDELNRTVEDIANKIYEDDVEAEVKSVKTEVKDEV